jgi:hypothetical protein
MNVPSPSSRSFAGLCVAWLPVGVRSLKQTVTGHHCMRFEQYFATAQGQPKTLPTAIIALIIGKNFRSVRRSVHPMRRASEVRCSCRLQRFRSTRRGHSHCHESRGRSTLGHEFHGRLHIGDASGEKLDPWCCAIQFAARSGHHSTRPAAGGTSKKPTVGHPAALVILIVQSAIQHQPVMAGIGCPRRSCPEEAGRRLTTVRERNQS